MKDTGQYTEIFLHHLEMPFSYLEWLFSQLPQCICINSSCPQLAFTEKLKLTQKIVLGSFTSSLQWTGLNCSRFLILINLLCIPGTKNDFHLKTALFPVFYSPIFRLFFAHSQLFYQTPVGAVTSYLNSCKLSMHQILLEIKIRLLSTPFAMVVWVQFQCYESVTMQLCFLGVTSAIKNHRNSNMYNYQPGVGTRH